MTRGRFAALVCSVVVMGTIGAPSGASAQSGDGGEIRVVTQNLYLGADLGDALARVPDVAAVAQSLWDQVAATDFPQRVPVLAAEVVAADPAVIGLQEATTWLCTPDAETEPVAVFDFTAEYLDATAAAGSAYAVASSGGAEAFSPGYAIDPIVGATVVSDPETFGPLFGTDTASCGFRIADALLVRTDLADDVVAVGIRTYDAVAELVPGFIVVQRGYAWADVNIDGTTVRFVTTHLESVWDPGAVPNSVTQSRQLVADLAGVAGPLVVMGDFNADPRDPRPAGEPNPGGQPEASDACQGRACNAYWTMVDAGYTDVGPDATDPANATWGADGLLAGPDLDRVEAAVTAGNPYGYTDRLDYVFVRNGVSVLSAEILGEDWPNGTSTWPCDDPEQVANTASAAEALGAPAPEAGVCLASDHAAIVATVALSEPGEAADGSSTSGNAGDEGGTGPVVWVMAGVGVVVVAGAAVALALRRSR